VAARGERIAVIATEHTVRSSAFGREIRRVSPTAKIFEQAEQRLVALVEGGCRDGRLSSECLGELERITEWVTDVRADTLVLGCTHFSHLEATLGRMLPDIRIVSPAREGALALARKYESTHRERGKTVYT